MSQKIAHVVPVRDFPTTTTGFDYLIPNDLNIEVGQLCQISFRNTNILGVVFAIKNKSDYQNLKTLFPLANKIIFKQAWLDTIAWFSEYYFYSFGSTLKLFFPKFGKKLFFESAVSSPKINVNNQLNLTFEQTKFDFNKGVLLHANTSETIYNFYYQLAKNLKILNKSLLIICPDQNSINKLTKYLQVFPIIKLDSSLTDKQWRENWLQAIDDTFKIVLATQKGTLTPINNLGAIIVDQENSPGQIQSERNPRYDCRLSAINYANNLNIPIILSSLSPSVFSLNLVKAKTFTYYPIKLNERKKFLVVDQTVELVASKQMFGPIAEKEIKKTIAANKPTFIFSFYHQPKIIYCLQCGKENSPQQVNCIGCQQILTVDRKSTDGIKNELNNLKLVAKSADDFKNDKQIYIGGLKHLSTVNNLGLTIIIDSDNVLNIPNLKSSEKLRSIIDQLNSISDKLIIISKNCDHYCYKQNFLDFIKSEIEVRRKYQLPPFGNVFHISSKQFNASDIETFKQALAKEYNQEILSISGPYKDKANKLSYLIVRNSSNNSLAKMSKYMYSSWTLDRHPADLLK